MGLWYRSVRLRDGEAVVFRAPGNLFRDRRQLGGRLTVTGQRFLYEPSRLAERFGVGPVAVELADVTALQLAKPGKAAVRERGAGAMRRFQVEITSAAGTVAVSLRDHEGLMKAISEARRA